MNFSHACASVFFSLAAMSVAAASVKASAHTDGPRNAGYLALGDSYTIGEGVARPDSWPLQLAQALKARDAGLAAQLRNPEILAQTGWTCNELQAAMRQHVFAAPYALVTLLIGVNDQYRNEDVAIYRVAFTHLLQRAIELAGGSSQRVVVVSIPDWAVTPFARDSGRDVATISHEIDLYNVANKEISQTLHVAYVDVTALSRARQTRDLLVDDQLHPSAAQYGLWAQAIAPTAANAMRAPD